MKIAEYTNGFSFHKFNERIQIINSNAVPFDKTFNDEVEAEAYLQKFFMNGVKPVRISRSLHDTVKIKGQYFDRGIINGELKYFRIFGQDEFVFYENFGRFEESFIAALKTIVPKGLSNTGTGVIDNSKLTFERYFELNHKVHKHLLAI
jgi:hypothetical protein